MLYIAVYLSKHKHVKYTFKVSHAAAVRGLLAGSDVCKLRKNFGQLSGRFLKRGRDQ